MDENLKLMDSKYKLGQSLSLVSRLILSANLDAVLLEADAEDQCEVGAEVHPSA